MNRNLILSSSVLLFLAALLAPVAGAQTVTPKSALARLFSAPIAEEQFSGGFLEQISVGRVRGIISNIESQLGTFIRVDGEHNPYTIVFSGGSAEAGIAVNSKGEIEGLRFTKILPTGANLADELSKLRALPGSVAWLIDRNGEPIASNNADRPFAVGSAFKLGVLSVLADRIESGKRAWDDVVRLDPTWKSLPTGILQDWPAGSPLTLHSLAELMISISDNTAADTLIHLLGREAIERALGTNAPLLTTREAAVLKDPKNSALLKKWERADLAGKRNLLATLDRQPLPNADIYASGPVQPQIEWFVTARKLAALLERTEGLDVFSVNPGVAEPTQWQSVAFKGGSEPGVLNLSTFVRASDGTTYTVVVTWNRSDADVDQSKLVAIYSGILSALRSGGS
ncbi:serine hydrolase [Salinispira pacifica]